MQRIHIVYLIEFTKRKMNNILPYYYIGSKSNCIFDGKNILDENNKPYYGSSKAKGYFDALKLDIPKISILGTYKTYEECVAAERELHLHHDVAANTKYWNLSIAQESNYSNPNYATYRNINTGKVVRLHRSHPLVLSKEYVGVSSNMHWYTDGKTDKLFFEGSQLKGWYRGRSRNENVVRGDEHYMRKTPLSKEEVMRRCRVRSQRMLENPELYAAGKARQRKAASKTHKGVAKSPESNLKRSISNKDYITLKNAETGECVRIKRQMTKDYDLNVWKNPYALAQKRLGAKWYNNGVLEKKLFPEDKIPEGYMLGRLPRASSTKKVK